jgi:tetratricopeptide (TPR) repeat protein
VKTKGNLDGALKHYQAALAIDPKSAVVLFNVGSILRSKGDLDSAIQYYRAALASDPKVAPAHNNLGNVLQAKGDLHGAIKHYQAALAIDAKLAPAHNNLGIALRDKKDLDGAVQHFHKAIALDSKYPLAHCNLGLALRQQAKFSAALEAMKKGHALGSKLPNWNQPTAEWIKELERLLELEPQLPAILKGSVPPQQATEPFDLAELCYLTKHHVSAARFFSAALAKAPPPLVFKYRYSATCAAILAATGKSKDAANVTKDEPPRLRQQALTWLHAELAMTKQIMATDPSKAGLMRYQCQLWQCDPDLASVRDKNELAKLPELERQAWQQLWVEVDRLLQ